MAIELIEDSATILFGDINGFVRLCNGLSPLKAAEFLHDFYTSCARAIEDEGGHIDRFMGDAVLATFNLPEPVEGAERRAVAAARQLQNLVKALPHVSKYKITIGCGIHTGPVVAGQIGVGASKTYTVLGDTVNTAAQLCYKANKDLKEGGIFISEPVATIMARGSLEEVDPITSGKNSIRVFKVL